MVLIATTEKLRYIDWAGPDNQQLVDNNPRRFAFLVTPLQVNLSFSLDPAFGANMYMYNVQVPSSLLIKYEDVGDAVKLAWYFTASGGGLVNALLVCEFVRT